jgi:hypothetical protein
MNANAWLDTLPRSTFGRYTRPVPAFRTCGIVGFYGAVVVTFGVGLAGGGSPLVLALVALVAGGSFFAWALLRRRVTGTEKLVLLEHVWIAEACVTCVLLAAGVPPLRYLDALSVGLSVFLAAGRIGCTLVGCCHGRPSSIGIRYGPELVEDGFTADYVGVRLLPVPALEALALLGIGLAGAVAVPFVEPGAVFVWFLLAYSVVRFGLEGLRGDERPHLLGLSVNRWMCVAELALALGLGYSELGGAVPRVAAAAIAAALAGALASALVALRATDTARASLEPRHVEELRGLVRELVDSTRSSEPALRTSSRGVAVGVSRARNGAEALHVSLSLPRPDLELCCRVAAAALPEIDPATATATPGLVLHVLLHEPLRARPPTGVRARTLYGAVTRGLQSSSTGEDPGKATRAEYFGRVEPDLRAAS